jgi:uncharacterized protein YhaN
MRLRRLNLTRYGHFTDFFLDFGDHSANSSDFHIIFGSNEAGKSTAFNGYLDLLFGIEERSRYGFFHDYPALRVGAILEIGDRKAELARIKRRGVTLLDTHDQPADEQMLASALYGLSRETYQTLFSLNDETIERGGEEILASKGDIGRLLFSGAAGIASLSEKMEQLRERARKMYAERSSSEISDLKEELKKLDTERYHLDVPPNVYERLIATSQKAEEACEGARRERDRIRNEHSNLETLKSAFPIWDDLIKLEKQLTAVKDLPEAPIEWLEEARELQKKGAVAERTLNDAQAEMDTISKELENLADDPKIIQMQDELTAAAKLAMQNEAARDSLPQLRDELSKANACLDEIFRQLGADESIPITNLIVSDDALAHLHALLEKGVRVTQSLKTAQQEAADAQEVLLDALEWEKRAESESGKAKRLCGLPERYAGADVQQHLEQAEKLLSERHRKVERELKKLDPWTGNCDDISLRKFPTVAQADIWCDKIHELEKELANYRRRQAELRERKALLVCRVNALSGQVGAITDATAAHFRKVRDTAWAEHQVSLGKESAAAFEKALAEDDRIRDERFSAADCLAQLRIAETELMQTESLFNVLADEIHKIENALQALRNEMKPLLIQAGLSEDFSIERLPQWLECVQRVHLLIEDENESHAEWELAKNDYDYQRKTLLQTLEEASEKNLETLCLRELCAVFIAYRAGALKEEERLAAAKESATQAKAHVRRRKKVLEAIKEEHKEWKADWERATKGFWFEQKSIEQIRALLDPLRRLTPALARSKAQEKAVNAREGDCQRFDETVRRLICSLGLKEENSITFSSLQQRLKNAKAVESVRNAAINNQKTAERRLETAKMEVSRIEERVKEMAFCFSTIAETPSLDRLVFLLDRVKCKYELIDAISETERRLFQHFGIQNRAEVEKKLGAGTPLSVHAMLKQVDADLESAERGLEKRIEERRDASRAIEAIGGDASIAHFNEKRRSILLEIADKTRRALSLHLGLMAADHALAAYRDRHSSELLKQTAEAFKIITMGEFTRLAIRPDSSGDRLLAVRSDGRSIATEAMSKGTRFQLYLALRLAAYRQFCSSVSGSLPFIGDDIMETFDDARSKATLSLLGEMAKTGQVLYFTHHQHLCTAAKNIWGDEVKIHEICRNPGLARFPEPAKCNFDF